METKQIRILQNIIRGGWEYKKGKIVEVEEQSYGLEVRDNGFYPGSYFKYEEEGNIWTYNLSYSPFEDSMEHHEKMA